MVFITYQEQPGLSMSNLLDEMMTPRVEEEVSDVSDAAFVRQYGISRSRADRLSSRMRRSLHAVMGGLSPGESVEDD